MLPKILVVDDDLNVFRALRRLFCKRFEFTTVADGAEAIEALQSGLPFAVVLSDFAMPRVDGLALFQTMKSRWPNTVRVMITGVGDRHVAARAVNEGGVFRFLVKPCAADVIRDTLEAAVRQHVTLTTEQRLMEETLRGVVRVLVDVLSMVSPLAFGRAAEVHRIAAAIAQELELADNWVIDVASMLSMLGCVAVPETTLSNVYSGEEVTASQQRMFDGHPRVAKQIVGLIPRFGPVADVIGSLEGISQLLDGERRSVPARRGAQVVHLAMAYDLLRARGLEPANAVEVLRGKGLYRGELLSALERIVTTGAEGARRRIFLDDLRPGVRLAEDVYSGEAVLVATGQVITPPLLARLRTLARMGRIPQAVSVLVPGDDDDVDPQGKLPPAAA